MTETKWERLFLAAERRRVDLRLTREAMHARGGPSSATMRTLRWRTGIPTVRQAPALLALDRALDWAPGTSWRIAGGKTPDDDKHLPEPLYVPICETCGRAIHLDDNDEWKHQ